MNRIVRCDYKNTKELVSVKASRKTRFVRWIAVCVAIVLGVGMCSGLPSQAATSADMTISQNGIDFIKEREGFSAKCYYDGAQSSIGYGTKCGTKAHASGLHSITRADAETAMRNEINRSYIPNVRRQTSGIEMNQNQFDALVSFTYNTGGGTSMIKNSPLVKYLRGEMSQAEATSAFQNYVVTNSATGKVDSGLQKRRRLEAELFFSGVNPDPNPPTNLSITSNDGKYKVGDTVTFTFSCSNATEMYIPIDVNGERKYFIDVSGRSSYTCSFDTPGVYGYFLYAKNAAGEASTVLDYKQFRVDSSVPANLTISTDKNSYAVGEQITFSFSCDNAVRVAIPVDYNGKRTDFIDVTGKNTYTCSFDKAGIYGYFLYAENACGESTTEYIEFTVQDNPPSNLSISTDKSYYVIGETITFSFTSQNATRLAIPIDYNGKRVDFIDVTGKDTYTCSFDKAGTYGYFLYAENACGESSTVLDYKQIQVYDTIPGDLNSDNTLTTADAVFLQNYLLNAATLTADQQQAADLNADGVVNALDLALLRQKLA